MFSNYSRGEAVFETISKSLYCSHGKHAETSADKVFCGSGVLHWKKKVSMLGMMNILFEMKEENKGAIRYSFLNN